MERSGPNARLVLQAAAIFLGVALVMIETTIVSVALPVMAVSLGVTDAESTWLVLSYQAVLLALLFPAIAFASFAGAKRLFLFGILVLTASSLACALCDSFEALLVFRVLMAVGGAAMLSVNIALVESVFPKERLAFGIGCNTATISISIILGPAIAGFILLHASWPWLFGIVVPFGLLTLVFAALLLPDHGRQDHEGRMGPAVAILGLSLVLFAGLFGVTGTLAWGIPLKFLPLSAIVFAAGLCALHRQQRASSLQLFPQSLARNRGFVLSLVCIVVCFSAQSCAVLAMPFHFMEDLAFSVAETSVLLIFWPMLHSLASVSSGHAFARLSPSRLCLAGMTLCTAGLLSLFLFPSPGFAATALCIAVCGLGYGLFQAPNDTISLMWVPLDMRSQTSAILAFCRTLGQTLGAMVTAGCFLWMPDDLELPFLLAGFMGLAGMIATGLRWTTCGDPAAQGER